jgi:hypothetical protein
VAGEHPAAERADAGGGGMSELTEDERRFLVGVFDSMLIHQQAHAM